MALTRTLQMAYTFWVCILLACYFVLKFPFMFFSILQLIIYIFYPCPYTKTMQKNGKCDNNLEN